MLQKVQNGLSSAFPPRIMYWSAAEGYWLDGLLEIKSVGQASPDGNVVVYT